MDHNANEAAPVDLRPGLVRAFLGIWIIEWQGRLTWGKLGAAASFVFAIPLLMFITLKDQQSEPFLWWVLNFHLLLAVPLNCLSLFGPLIRDELQSDTLGFMVTRPLKRHTLFILKFLCVMLWSQVLAFLSALVFIAVAWSKDIEMFYEIFPLFLTSQALAVLAYGALAGLLGLLSKRYMVLGVVYGFLIERGIGSIPTNIHSLSIFHNLKSILGNNGEIAERFGWTAGSIPEATIIVTVAAVFFLTAGALIFSVREYHHAEEMQK